MKVLLRIAVGVINTIVFFSVFINSSFWTTGEALITAPMEKKLYIFVSFFAQLLMYLTSFLFTLYCFKSKLRLSDRFWSFNFILNCFNLLAVMGFVFFGKFTLMNNSKVGADFMVIFSPLGILFALNLIVLFLRKSFEEQHTNDSVKTSN